MNQFRFQKHREELARTAFRLNARGSDSGVPPLILMTDETVAADWCEAVNALPRRSAVIVRHSLAREREALARLLLPKCRLHGVRLLIAQDMALAHRLRADGVHIPERARGLLMRARQLQPRWLITTSAHSLRAVLDPRINPADAVLLSPLFATKSHADGEELGTVRFSAIAVQCRVPVLALGGLTERSATQLSQMPVAGFGVIRGWLSR